jgi:hypothetical protein
MTDKGRPYLVRKVKEMLDQAGIGPDDPGPDDPDGAPAKPRRRKPKPKPKPNPDVSISLTGSGSHQAAGRDFYDQSTRVEKILPPPVVVKTGDGVLDAKQKSNLQKLVNEVVKASVSKQEQRTHRAIWSALNGHMKVNSYHEIRAENFKKAAVYLQRLKATYNSLPLAHKKNPLWRNERIKGIQSRCNERGWQPWRKKYMKEKFGRESMIDMPDSEIESLYRAVMGKK